MDSTSSRRTFIKAAGVTAAATAAVTVAANVVTGAGTASAQEASSPARPELTDLFAGKGNARQVTDDIWWVGAADKRLALFENAYPLEQGMTYNSYLIMDDKVALIDTCDRAVMGQYLENLAAVLGDRLVDYLVVDHMEPDHSAAIALMVTKFPDIKIVTSAAGAALIGQFFDMDISDRLTTVAEGDTLELGSHTLAFVEAPMVHWPEVLMAYDSASGVLFSADAFGSFNSLDGNIFADQVDYANDWMPEARRFYTNIVGKYGPQVQDALDKAAELDIKYICSTHGLVWRQDIDTIVDKYRHWSSYEPEDQAAVIFYGSIYGGTECAANILASKLSEAGVSNVKVYDVAKTHKSWLLAEAFRASHLVFASMTYNMGVFTSVKELLNYLVDHNMQNRHVAFIENGSWQPVAGDLMRGIAAQMADIKVIGDTVTLTSTVDEENVDQLATLAEQIAASINGDDSAAQDLVAQEDATNPAAGDLMHTNADTAKQAAASNKSDGSGSSDAAESESADSASDESAGGTSQWRCSVCGYIYEGESLPDDFVCPVCGATADKFEKVS